ncbi:MAG TPA: Com family DNA-binding transcriptional regulator [Syntrophomonadaceae bacterium]|nr:Com family DNA-binding transcriptional regulator [Syntrophomonadaceae bacterium]
MDECRCPKCGKLLALIHGVAEIKCSRCGSLNVYRSKSSAVLNTRKNNQISDLAPVTASQKC